MSEPADFLSQGSVRGGVRTLLRLEAAVVLLLAVIAYRQAGGGWGLFALLFLVPDVSFLAYSLNPRAGAAAYNALHSYAGALALAAFGMLAQPSALLVALIWIAHIAWDRAIGYGLKYSDGFGVTHMGLVGPAKRAAAGTP